MSTPARPAVQFDPARLALTSLFTVLIFSGALAIGYALFAGIAVFRYGDLYSYGSDSLNWAELPFLAVLAIFVFALSFTTGAVAGAGVGFPLALLARLGLKHSDRVWAHLIVSALIPVLTTLVVNLVYLRITEPSHLADSATSLLGITLIALAAVSGPLAWLWTWRMSTRAARLQRRRLERLQQAEAERPAGR